MTKSRHLYPNAVNALFGQSFLITDVPADLLIAKAK